MLEITIHDDDNIEPVREIFTVTLDAPAAGASCKLGSVTTADLTIEEGVCDRTLRPQKPYRDCQRLSHATRGGSKSARERYLAILSRVYRLSPRQSSCTD